MIQDLLDFISGNQNIYGFLALMAGAGIEYLFPPFPGDTITLLGGVLVAARGWSTVFVFSAVTLGSMVGFMLDYALGHYLLRNPDAWLSRRLAQPGTAKRVERVINGFRRYGAVFLIANRFLPGVRAFFFIAAGMADIAPWRVLLWGGLSAAAWNALILIAGYAVGGSLPELESLFSTYTTVAWSVLLTLVVGYLLLSWWRGRKEKEETGA